jgi:hypothetical protein
MKTWKHKAGTPEHVDFMVTSPDIWKTGFREQLEALDVRDHLNLETAGKVGQARGRGAGAYGSGLAGGGAGGASRYGGCRL